MLRWWVEGGGGSCGFPCGVRCIGAEFMPVVAVVADEVSYFAEGLIRYDVLKGHVCWDGGGLGVVVSGEV